TVALWHFKLFYFYCLTPNSSYQSAIHAISDTSTLIYHIRIFLCSVTGRSDVDCPDHTKLTARTYILHRLSTDDRFVQTPPSCADHNMLLGNNMYSDLICTIHTSTTTILSNQPFFFFRSILA
ncbi:hypothetical protein VCUG_02689, partial [Vavraia culicis subsp. floridensis]